MNATTEYYTWLFLNLILYTLVLFFFNAVFCDVPVRTAKIFSLEACPELEKCKI